MSEINFSCPSCNQQLVVGAEFEGQQVLCSSCQTGMIAPQAPVMRYPGLHSSNSLIPNGIPGAVKFLAWCFVIGSLPFIAFALFE